MIFTLIGMLLVAASPTDINQLQEPQQRPPEIRKFRHSPHVADMFELEGKCGLNTTTTDVKVEIYKYNGNLEKWQHLHTNQYPVDANGDYSAQFPAQAGYYKIRVYRAEDYPNGRYSKSDAIMP